MNTQASLTIEFHPSQYDFENLIRELDSIGFHNGVVQPHDRKRILQSFVNDEFIILKYQQVPIGFTVWEGENQWAEIQYKWILPQYRSKGIGRKFAELIFREFVNRNII